MVMAWLCSFSVFSVTSVVKVFQIFWSSIYLCVPSCPLWLCVLLTSETRTHNHPYGLALMVMAWLCSFSVFSVTSVVKVFQIFWYSIYLCVPSCPLWLSVFLTSQTRTHNQPFERGFRKRTHLRIPGAFSARSQLLPAEQCGLQRPPRDAREDPLPVARPRQPGARRRENLLLWPPLHSWRLFPGECF
jgi:hypothetical protein